MTKKTDPYEQQKEPSRRPAARMTAASLFCAGLILAGAASQGWTEVESLSLADLSAFRTPAESWQTVGGLSVALDESGSFSVEKGAGIIVNLPSAATPGEDLLTELDHGDIDLELDYMMAQGANSGIYLQGRYELQLLDSWGKSEPGFGDNGGIYERWDETRPGGQKGFGGIPPMQNASRAPGLWQTLKLSFQAPRFNEAGEKTDNARLVRAELNGALIHENVELSGPTRGPLSEEESARGPLRIQGDHGPVAFRNIRIITYENPRPGGDRANNDNRILVDPDRIPLLRSFMDVPGGPRVTHAISVFNPEKVHYTYDLSHGALVQVWRGDFLDAAPMWHFRGDGSSRPLGAVRRLLTHSTLMVAELASADAEWDGNPSDGSFRPRGYRLDKQNRPTFVYEARGAAFEDNVRILDEGRGVERSLTVQNAPETLFARLADAKGIEQLPNGIFLIDDNAYYIRLDDAGGAEPLIRNIGDRYELLVPLRKKLTYSILF